LTPADEQRLRQYRERGTVEAVLSGTSWRFRLWTLVGFLALLAFAAILLWRAAVPDFDFVLRGISIALAVVYWPAIGAWAVRRSRLHVERPQVPSSSTQRGK
jgi:hypothetical protein